ncbi:hypothetical protein [Aeromonas veronii]|uniref:hypothetical protein n=1 Tax=Aeromonas veronii TaxID=654 RepID=UPI000390E3CA|nr:hypothetical protein [Aeromonas veronii]QMS78793.1 hypothetical protein M001_022005 [Aeromonas veronii Hm21]
MDGFLFGLLVGGVVGAIWGIGTNALHRDDRLQSAVNSGILLFRERLYRVTKMDTEAK